MARGTNLAVLGAAAAAFASQPSLRTFVAKWSGYNAPGGVWRIVAILFALANLKNMPFVWHLRFLRSFLYQLYFQPTPIPPHALFLPMVTSTRTPLLEMDYNIHKSNSTYFSDMDISRTSLFTALIRNAIRKNSRLYGKKKPGLSAGEAMGSTVKGGGEVEGGPRGKHLIALGGITCLFKREIPVYQKFEMWTRLLCWDQKWFYLVTHLVRPGVAKPPSYTFQPWKKGKERAVETVEEEKATREKLRGAIFATGLAKYVIKRGRITVPPEQALFDADMVPAKPEGWAYKGKSYAHVAANGAPNGNVDINAVLPEPIEGEWNWDVIEEERLRGLSFAENFVAMDGLHEVWDGGQNGVLGEYMDFSFV